MIDMSTYMTTVGILSAIIMAFVIYCLKINKIEKEKSDLMKENSDLKTQVSNLQGQNSQSELIIRDQEKQLASKKIKAVSVSDETPPSRPRNSWVKFGRLT
jgi:hypothetical protein